MRFIKLPLPDAFIIEQEKREDDRGFFARTFCTNEFAQHGLETTFVQMNNSFSRAQGTLRGLHYQLGTHAETKIVRCIKGSIMDLILDLRPDSPTYKMSFCTELTDKNRKMMYVPKGFAHGFFTLTPNSEILYMVSCHYSPEHERGIRWDDPTFSLVWPNTPKVISERDSSFPNYNPKYHQGVS